MDSTSIAGRTFVYCRENAAGLADEQLAAVNRAGFHIQPGCLVLEDVPCTVPVTRRKQFSGLLAMVREGDALVVGGLDALGRTAGEMLHVMNRLAQAGVALYCAPLGDRELAAGDGAALFRATLGEVATAEREQMLERAQSGRSRAGSLRTVRTRLPSPAMRAEIAGRLATGVPVAQIAREYRLPRQAIIRMCTVRAAPEERVVSVPAKGASRHAIEALAMLAGDEAKRG
ncbi:MAG TPA: recombinase family protein [Noviherbaspirillum sp.]|jgi:putative DNA-invertase from lambdoid prophage Rac|uniref:recombinase family protein n=1 Tax=Noviherbaspirillum sp. TaxID=1926288 RepID=UPI002F94B41A